MRFIASAAFGLEGLVKRDLMRLGARGIAPLETGGVAFEGGMAECIRANMWLRTADRVLLEMGAFQALSFDQLFEGVRAIPWEDVLPTDAAFPVRAQCARSQLMSPSDCQSIVKKAIVERLRDARGVRFLPETGAVYQVDAAIRKDMVTVSLDTSGAALNRRGYRTLNGIAPIRETLAASLALISPWRPSMPLIDPCCGTGTLLIESAFIALDRAPGLMRPFDCEKWAILPSDVSRSARAEAEARYEEGQKRPLEIAGSDIDPEAVKLSEAHIERAGLRGRVTVKTLDLRDLPPDAGAGAMLLNPPYGERMGDKRAAQAVAKQLGVLLTKRPHWSLTAITGDRGFEKALGRRADKRRRLYNGRIECEALIFMGREEDVQ